MTRAEHLAWAKARALACIDSGNADEAFASMAQDLRTHPELADHRGIDLGMRMLFAGLLHTDEELRRYINGFN